MSRRPKWWMRVWDEGPKKDREPVGVFELCEMVHMHCRGTLDINYADLTLAARCLTWLAERGHDPTCDYEKAVMDLVDAALDEYAAWKAELKSDLDAERAA